MVKRASLLVIVAVTAAFASNASASQLVDRNATAIKLEVNSKGEALLSYKSQGKLKHVLAWGAENAIAPTRTRQQIAFKLDYAGGWGKYHSDYWRTFKNSCGAYDGPKLAWFVTGCTAADGSYWALQAWQRMLPNYGLAGSSPSRCGSSASHTGRATSRCSRSTPTGPGTSGITCSAPSPTTVAVLRLQGDAGRQPARHLRPQHLRRHLRLRYGKGWKRENSFLTQNTGVFCYSVNPHGSHPAGKGRSTARRSRGPA